MRQPYRAMAASWCTVMLLFSATVTYAQDRRENAAGMSALDVLVAKDQIREQFGRYTLLLDGDGLTRDPDKWAEQLFTEDATFQSIGPDGEKLHGPDGIVGRAAIARTFGGGRSGNAPPPAADTAATATRHFPIDIVFDELTPTMARTRTTTIIMTGYRRNVETQRPLGNPHMIVYHDLWRKTPDGWKKASSVLRYTTWRPAFGPPPPTR